MAREILSGVLKPSIAAIRYLASSILHLIFLLLLSSPALSQSLKYPWAGGMNSCQYCPVDLNGDGRDDLLVFDRHGNRLMTFIDNGIDFFQDQNYVQKFPGLHDWVITADYNCDGKMDIFTYGTGGIRVYENVSDTDLRFRLITSLLTSYYYTGYVGILLTPVDYPAIADIDGDGDLDILTFFGLGSWVEYHRNMSIEKYGTCDSLDYRLEEHCWGDFRESESSNVIQLNVPCPYAGIYLAERRDRHTGSTLLAADLNGDGLKDLVLGDVDYPGLVALYNGGTPDSAVMVSEDTLFPSGTEPVVLWSFPSSALADADHDGIRDLLVSPFYPNYYIAENIQSSWYYRNEGTESSPVFRLKSKGFLQDEMLDFGSISYPVFTDLDNDGLQDLAVGCYGVYDSSWYYQGVLKSAFTGRIALLRNTGSGFTLVTDDLAGVYSLSKTGTYPAFGDLNGDGFPDMLTGTAEGQLIYFQNRGNGKMPPEFLEGQPGYQSINPGSYSAPQLFDLDRDGLQDLICGERAGNLSYYRNTGTASNPVFTLVTDSLGKINVTNYALSYDGFSTPCFFRSGDGITRLVVGCEEGKLYYYDDIDGNLEGRFAASDSLFTLIDTVPVLFDKGWRSSAALFPNPGKPFMNLVTGNFSGGLNFYSQDLPPQVVAGISTAGPGPRVALEVFPNPATDRVRVRIPGGRPASGVLQVSDIAGRRVNSIEMRDEAVFPVSGYPSGIYFLTFLSADLPPVNATLLVRH